MAEFSYDPPSGGLVLHVGETRTIRFSITRAGGDLWTFWRAEPIYSSGSGLAIIYPESGEITSKSMTILLEARGEIQGQARIIFRHNDVYMNDYYIDVLPAPPRLNITYNGETIKSFIPTFPVSVKYGASEILSITGAGTHTLLCGGKRMSGNVTVGGYVLPCADKLMATDVVITVTS